MKRAIIAIISVIMALSLFVACGEEPEPKKITGLTLPDKTVTYDGEAHSLEVEGNTEGCEIVYTNNGKTEVGEYTVTATVTKEGYETLTLTGKLTIEAAEEPTPEFKDKTVKYNGGAQVIEVSGVPEGAVVEYDCNEYTKPGVYEVKAVVKIDGQDDIELTATFTIEKARLTVQVVNAEKQLYDPNPEFEFKFTGLQGTDEYVEPEEPQPPEEGGEEAPVEELPSGNGIFSGKLIATTDAEQYSEQGVYRVMPSGIESEYYDITFRAGNLTVKTYTTNLVKGGLQVNAKGETQYNGKIVNWLGVNYFSMAYHRFDSATGEPKEEKVQEVYRSLELLKSYNVKAIRFNNFFFYAHEMKPWIDNREIMLKTYDRIFNKAASLDIGLIPSMFFAYPWCNYYNEGYTATMRNPETNTTKTFAATMEYTRIMVERYAEHPAIFMWEFGNESNLGIDLPNFENKTEFPTEDVKPTLAALSPFREYWADLVYSLDPYHRLIGSGDGELRRSQYNQHVNNSWTTDTYNEHLLALELMNPGKMSSISIHTYLPTDLARIAETYGYNDSTNEYKALMARLRALRGEEGYEVELARLDKSNLDEPGQMSDYFGATNLVENFNLLMQEAKTLGKSCYVGEAGFGVNTYGETCMILGNEENGYKADYEWEEFRLSYRAFAEAARATKMPLVLFWNFDPVSQPSMNETEAQLKDRGTGVEHSWNDVYWNKGKIILATIKEYNDMYDAENNI